MLMFVARLHLGRDQGHRIDLQLVQVSAALAVLHQQALSLIIIAYRRQLVLRILFDQLRLPLSTLLWLVNYFQDNIELYLLLYASQQKLFTFFVFWNSARQFYQYTVTKKIYQKLRWRKSQQRMRCNFGEIKMISRQYSVFVMSL